MSEGAIVDTDVLMKVSAYRMADDLIGVLAPLGQPSTLGLIHLIAHKQIVKLEGRLADVEGAVAELRQLLGNLSSVEPSGPEVELAAELEEVALADGLPLDRGEAQLVAVLIKRGLPLLLTGDKRAIGCFDAALKSVGLSEACAERVACLEQFLMAIVARDGVRAVRARVCAEPEMDTALRLCFGCGRVVFEEMSVNDGLNSYTSHTRACGRGVLFSGDLSTLA